MLSAILVQIQEFGDVGLEFLNSWGVTPLTEKFIEEFKANKDNWPYLQGGYYVGLTSVVEYMNVQTDGTKNTIGAFETVRGIAVSLGLSAAQVRNLGAISDSLFICVSSFYLLSICFYVYPYRGMLQTHTSHYFIISFAGEVLVSLNLPYKHSSEVCISLHQHPNPILVKCVLFHCRSFMMRVPPQKQLEMEIVHEQTGSSLLASLATRPLM